MRVKFWGVRGSIPCPGPDTLTYGGNTSCIELGFGNPESRIIIDAGSGIRELGNHMMSKGFANSPGKIDLFLTHTHWDHIMGLPFFTPMYLKKCHLKIYGPVSFENDSLKEIVSGQMIYRYFPIRQTELVSQIDYIELKEGLVNIENSDISITATYLNHPVLCLGYRFEHQGKRVCTVFDTEPFHNIFITDPQDPSFDEILAVEGQKAAQKANERLHDFYKNADLIIRDAQYTKTEYLSSKKGWGHSSMEDAIEHSYDAGAKKLALFHHDPVHSDEKLDRLSESLCRQKKFKNMDIFFAKEGMEIEL